MDSTTFAQAFDSLPEEMKNAIIRFADSLVHQRVEKHADETRNIVRKFGSDPGYFQIASDFDEPLEEFKEYME
jgi:hypothetical protein